jgi:hypothetical protein
VELFRKKDSRFYSYDFKVRGKRHRGSNKETNKKRAGRIAALRFSQAIEGTGLLDRKAPSLQELSARFRSWVESAGLASKTRKYYANGWRLLSSTCIVGMHLDHITKDHVEVLRFGGSAANVSCALRTLRPMLHKGEEWNLLIKVPQFKLWPEHGRKLSPSPGLRNTVTQARTLLLRLKEARTSPLQFIPDEHDVSHLPAWVRAPKQITHGHLSKLATANAAVLATLDESIPGSYLIPK